MEEEFVGITVLKRGHGTTCVLICVCGGSGRRRGKGFGNWFAKSHIVCNFHAAACSALYCRRFKISLLPSIVVALAALHFPTTNTHCHRLWCSFQAPRAELLFPSKNRIDELDFGNECCRMFRP